MAFDRWWVGAFVDESRFEQFEPEFAKAAGNAVLSANSLAALDAWRRRPSDFEQAAVRNDAAAARVHDFIWPFNLPGFDQLVENFLTQDGIFSSFLAEDALFRMVTTARTTPASIVWHALGDERAKLLPGRMGNMFCIRARLTRP